MYVKQKSRLKIVAYRCKFFFKICNKKHMWIIHTENRVLTGTFRVLIIQWYQLWSKTGGIWMCHKEREFYLVSSLWLCSGDSLTKLCGYYFWRCLFKKGKRNLLAPLLLSTHSLAGILRFAFCLLDQLSCDDHSLNLKGRYLRRFDKNAHQFLDWIFNSEAVAGGNIGVQCRCYNDSGRLPRLIDA